MDTKVYKNELKGNTSAERVMEIMNHYDYIGEFRVGDNQYNTIYEKLVSDLIIKCLHKLSYDFKLDLSKYLIITESKREGEYVDYKLKLKERIPYERSSFSLDLGEALKENNEWIR